MNPLFESSDFLTDLADRSELHHANLQLRSGWLQHAPFLRFALEVLNPDVYVELGTHRGFSYFTACDWISKKALSTRTYSIDTWAGDSQAGYFDETVYEDVVRLNQKYSYSTLHRMKFAEAIDLFQDASVDILHIDGRHGYADVNEDFSLWVQKVKDGGVILLHDVFMHATSFGTNTFWSEIKNQYQYFEFSHGYGLGVIKIGGKATDLDFLFELKGSKEILNLQGIFAAHGDQLIQELLDLESSVRLSALAERDSALVERDSALAERDSALAERDSALAERDSALAEHDLIIRSTIWRLFSPYRNAITFLRRS